MQEKQSSKKGLKRLFFIPLLVGGIFGLMYLFPFWNGMEKGIYDLFLHMKPAVKEDPSIRLLNIDDESILNVGMFPWPRGLIARGLEVLTEARADYIVFDIEFLEKSPLSVDKIYLDSGLNTEFNTVFGEIASNMNELFNALSSKTISLNEASEYGVMLGDSIADSRDNLYKKANLVAVENDAYLGKAMRLFGNSFATLNNQPEIGNNRTALAEQYFAYPKISSKLPMQSKYKDFFVPLPEVTTMVRSGGFTNVEVDPDGTLRTIQLIEEIQGKYYLQLAMAPLMHKLGNPEIQISKTQLLLKNASINGKIQTIRIPLDTNGKMLINWPKKKYADSFKSISFYRLLEYRNAEDKLSISLRKLKTKDIWRQDPNGYIPIDALLEANNAVEDLRLTALETGNSEDRKAWLDSKIALRSATQNFFALNLDASISRIFEAFIQSSKAAGDAALAQQQSDAKESFLSLYADCKETAQFIEKTSSKIKADLAGTFCIVGWSGAATTDLGVNPFQEDYVNIGVHASTANTILQQDFLTESPVWISSLLSMALSILIILVIARLKTMYQIVLGIGSILVVFFAGFLVFRFTGIYIALLSPLLAVFLSFLAYTLISFLLSEREKSFLRKAFSTYLSTDVINELVDDPSSLKLGGKKEWITAMFTDIRGFSSVSEKLDAEQLVTLLNLYLSGMSDIILDERGTIDKYEGDAIIAFFGAPINFKEHALNACLSSIRMKQKEAELNIKFLADNITPNALLTRIGLNTGEMVVGNMGTEKKMNYTIMGNAVNLAARLEGVNKQYGSWILMSDETCKAAGDSFLSRRLDKVRVVGINTPVQLWELIGLKSETDNKTTGFLSDFETAHEIYDSRDWKKASAMLGKLLKENPEDGPTKTYLKRSDNFQQMPPEANWDGVFNLSEK